MSGNAWVNHTVESLKLHALVFTSHSHCSIPVHARYTLENIGAKYSTQAESYPPTGKLLFDVDNAASLPTLEELTEFVNWAEYPKVKTAWKIEFTGGWPIAKITLWEFWQEIKKIPNLPRGILAWAAYAKPGDVAEFYQQSTGRKFLCSLKEV